MLNKPDIEYIQLLYENIFEESVNNSKEFTTFVQNENPHLLRIKVEDFRNTNMDNIILLNPDSDKQDRLKFIEKMVSAMELDTFITNYIENNYV